MKIRIALLVALALLAGCAHREREEVIVIEVEPIEIEPLEPIDLTGVPLDGDGVRWFAMSRHSDLYRDPVPPPGMNRAQADDFIRGYRIGWKDVADDYLVGVPPGSDSLELIYIPASFLDPDATPAFREGEAAGRRQARQDFDAFCEMLEGKLDH